MSSWAQSSVLFGHDELLELQEPGRTVLITLWERDNPQAAELLLPEVIFVSRFHRI